MFSESWTVISTPLSRHTSSGSGERRPDVGPPEPSLAAGGVGHVSTTEERSYVEAARREKRAELERLGILAYAYRFERTHTAAAALAEYHDDMGDAGPRVRIAGRINRLGSHGKTSFAHVEEDRKSTRLNSSHSSISYAVFCLKKKKK